MATASSKIEDAVAALRRVDKDLKTRMAEEPPHSTLFYFLRDQEDRIHEALAALGE